MNMPLRPGSSSFAGTALTWTLAAWLGACGSKAPPVDSARAGQPAATAATQRTPTGRVPPAALMAPHDGPTLYLSSDDSAPAIGYTAPDLRVEPAEPPVNGRVLVRVDGALRVRAYAPVELLTSKVQRRGRIRGAPVYVGPGDRLHVVGPAEQAGRVEVEVRARIGDGWSATYAGTYPAAGVALQDPPDEADEPAEGQSYVLPAGRSLTLYDKPGGSVVAGLPAGEVPIAMTRIRGDQAWHAVRVGSGPYLIGYTRDAIQPSEGPEPPAEPIGPSADGEVPGRIARESGELKRVRAGAKLRFNGDIIAVFKAEGWARVLAEYPDGQADVFAAADDAVAVRGLVQADQLYDVESSGD